MSGVTNLILTAEDAAYLVQLKERGHLTERISVSVKGKITALSDLMRVKNEWTFLIQMDNCITLIVTNFHRDWYSQLSPAATYIFYGLRLTVMERGSLKQHVVFLAWPTSSYIKVEDDNAVTCTPLQKWLENNNISGPTLLSVDHGYSSCDKDDDHLINYEGIVTSADQASDGIYVLDDKIRLYVQAICTPEMLQILKNHCWVSLYNAHIMENCKQAVLVCCSRTCIKTTDSGPNREGDRDMHSNMKSEAMDLKKIIVKYGLNAREIIAVIELKKTVAGQTRSMQDVLRTISFVLTSPLCHDMVKCRANSIDQFILHEEFCPFVNSKKHRCRIPTVLNISALKKEAVHRDGFEMKNKYSAHRMFYGLEENKILFGQIRISASGLTEFQDSNGCLPLVLLSHSSKKLIDDRNCTGFSSGRDSCKRRKKEHSKIAKDHTCCHCCLSQFEAREELICDILNPMIVGKKICVREFHFIVESCDGTDLPYLAFSLQNCLLLESMQREGTVERPVVSSASLDGASISTATNHDKLKVPDKLDEEHSFFVYVEEKHCILNFPKYQFQILGLKLAPSELACESIGCEFGKCRRYQTRCITADNETGKASSSSHYGNLENVCTNSCPGQRRKSGISPGKREKFQNLSHNNKTTFNKDDLLHGKVVVEQDDSVKVNELNSKAETSLQGKPIFLRDVTSPAKLKPFSISFCNSACRWYSFIVPGCLYKLSISKEQETLDPFIPVLPSARFEKATNKYNVRLGIEVSSEVSVERVITNIGANYVVPSSPGLLPIRDILMDSLTEYVVSLQGVIVNRRESDQSSFSSSSNKKGFTMTDFRLEVAELFSEECYNPKDLARIPIYLQAPSVIYSQGLVPGAIVRFERLERKVSKAGNVYCRFITVSACEVISFCNVSDYAVCKSSVSTSICDLPKEFLINIWHRGADGKVAVNASSLSWLIHCHVIMFYALRLKWSCSVCKATFCRHGCQGKGCKNATSSTQEAQAELLVEDGTCQAGVKVRDRVLVQRLLTLTDIQWEELMSVVFETGEIFISKQSPSSSGPLYTFLDALTKSSVVLRPCKMAVNVSSGSPSSLNVDKLCIEDFEEKQVRLGKTNLKTLSLPLLRVECFGLEDMN